MRKIEVKPGYYEWNAYANGELLYSFGGENLVDDVLRYKGLEDVADVYIEALQDEIKDGSVHIDLTPEEFLELKEQLVMAWAQHFGVSEEECDIDW